MGKNKNEAEFPHQEPGSPPLESETATSIFTA